MKTIDLSRERLAELVSRFGDARIAILGDFFLDKYLDIDPALGERSVETGKTAHQVIGVRCSPGAAGTVVCNLAALGAGTLHSIGFTGDDGESYDLRKQLANLGCSTEHLHIADDRFTPTYLKPRDADVVSLDAEHSRLDTKNRTATSTGLEERIVASLDSLLPNVDAVIVLDQVDIPDSGVVTTTVRESLSQRAKANANVLFWADSRRRIHDFPGLTIKPNQFEVMNVDNPLPDDEIKFEELLEAAAELRAKNEAPVVMTRGTHGMVVSDPEWTAVPGIHVDSPVDPTGAGDSATAGAVLALCAGATLAEAALVGNLVASITVQQINTTGTASPDQLAPRLAMWQQQNRLA
ncbi:MAG: carbohydrate kinase [Planctomycetales bacterium]|nr:carbohydrate kinase [Planctomycetales bacterium]